MSSAEKTKHMLLLGLTVSCLFLASCAVEVQEESLCVGDRLWIPEDFTPPLYNGPLYFIPGDWGVRRLLMDGGQSKDPRLQVSHSSVYLKDVTEGDTGTFSVSFNKYSQPRAILKLQVSDCANEVNRSYATDFEVQIPKQAVVLEFTSRLHPDQTTVLWNRTRNPPVPAGRKVRVWRGMVQVHPLTQADSGHYNFRSEDRTLLSRHLLTVKEETAHYFAELEKPVLIRFPWVQRTWTVTFTPLDGWGEDPHPIIQSGKKVFRDHWFTWRLSQYDDGLEINPVEDRDSGFFEFRDEEGYLALKAKLEVIHESLVVKVVFGAVVAAAVLFLCCCCYCCKKKCCKKNQSSSQPAPVVLHRQTDLSYSAPTASSYAAPASSYKPPTSSTQAPVYSPLNVHVSPEVRPSGGAGPPPSGSDFLSSDSEPRFELKGACSLPLSSDCTTTHVYSSDKLNFL